jgi:acyl-CoA thioesterase
MSRPGDGGDSRRADRAFLGLDMDDGGRRGRAVVTDRLLTPRGRFYGGGGIALAGAAMEAATGRRLRWVTTQFVSSARAGAEIVVDVDVAAQGRATSQAMVIGRVAGELLFQAVGATGIGLQSGGDVQFETPPMVPAPENCPALQPGLLAPTADDYTVTTELRDAGTAPAAALRVWARVPGHDATRPALLGYVADYLPLALLLALRSQGGSISLDNTIRVGGAPAAPSPWVLMELSPEVLADSYGQGRGRLWSQAGDLLGIASQTMRLVEPRHQEARG